MTKEEKKDEMKNRISLALKDPILQQGFEIICKENAELKERCNILDKSLVTSTKNNIERQKIIDELKEENAELKEHHKSVCKNLTDTHRNIREQLTRAKEILRLFLDMNDNLEMMKAQWEAEQFIKDSEVEK